MLPPSRRFWTYAGCVAASLSLAGFRAAPATTGHGTANHFNVGATHSPQLLRQLPARPHGQARGGRGPAWLRRPPPRPPSGALTSLPISTRTGPPSTGRGSARLE